MTEHLELQTPAEGVACIVMKRAPVNALSAGFLMDLAGLIDQVAEDETVRSVILASPFRVFSAGLDLKEAQAFDEADERAIVEGLNVGFLAIYACPKPVIAAVNGAAIAGGLFPVLAADYRIGVERATFGLAEVRVGADFPVGPLEIARDQLSPAMLRRLMLTGQPVDAETALTHGILDEIAAEDALDARALEVAVEMASLPPETFASVKRQVKGATTARILDALSRPQPDRWFSDETRPAMKRMIG